MLQELVRGYPYVFVVDLPGLQPHLAGDERVVGVAISAVITSRVKKVHPADDDEI